MYTRNIGPKKHKIGSCIRSRIYLLKRDTYHVQRPIEHLIGRCTRNINIYFKVVNTGDRGPTERLIGSCIRSRIYLLRICTLHNKDRRPNEHLLGGFIRSRIYLRIKGRYHRRPTLTLYWQVTRIYLLRRDTYQGQKTYWILHGQVNISAKGVHIRTEYLLYVHLIVRYLWSRIYLLQRITYKGQNNATVFLMQVYQEQNIFA